MSAHNAYLCRIYALSHSLVIKEVLIGALGTTLFSQSWGLGEVGLSSNQKVRLIKWHSLGIWGERGSSRESNYIFIDPYAVLTPSVAGALCLSG